MPDLDETLRAIDAATGCQQCEGPLGLSPSDDFCSDWCQEKYFAARSEPLVGYLEPSDLPQHVYNLVEEESPETTPACAWHLSPQAVIGDMLADARGPIDYRVTFEVTVDTSPLERALHDAGLRLDAWQRQVLNQVYGTRHGPDIVRAIEDAAPEPTDGPPFVHTVGGFALNWVVHDETYRLWRDTFERINEQLAWGPIDAWQPTGLINRLTASSPEPDRPEASTDYLDGFDFEYPTTACLVVGEVPAPAMSETTLDIESIQRMVDSYQGGYATPGNFRRRSRRINPKGTR